MVSHNVKTRPITFLFVLFWIVMVAKTTLAQEKQSDGSTIPAETPLEVITVTAEKRTQDIQKIPASVSVVSELQIEDFDLRSTPDIVSMVPNLYIIKTGNELITTFAAMRGIAGSMTPNPALGFYVDDIYYPSLDISLFDVERIEVLRGPQGTLYGRNSEAGVINVLTRQPTNVWESKLSLDIGSFNSFDVQGTLGGSLIDELLTFKAAVRYFKTDGYFENRFDGSKDGGSAENGDGRFSLRMTPSDNLNFTLVYDLQRYDSPKYANFAPLDSDDLRKDINVDFSGESNKDADGISLRAEYQMDGMSLLSITSGRDENSFLTNDLDFMPIDLSTLAVTNDVTSLSQEFRLVSDDTSNSPLKWLAGLFFLGDNSETDVEIWMNFMNMGMGMPGETLSQESSTDTRGAAVFGEATYTFFDRLNVTLGLRYDFEQKDFDYTQTPGGAVLAMMGYSDLSGSEDDTFDAWLPKAAVSYQLSNQIMPYISMSRGFRSGGFNTVEKMGTAYQPEFTWNYELGAKTSWLKNRLQVNAALFYIDWSDMQVEVLSSGGATSVIDNAGKATSKGIELELLSRPFAGLELIAGAAYTDATYDDYTKGINVYDGNRTIDSPKYTLNMGATYRFNSGFFVNAGYHHLGEIFFDAANTESQKSYGLANAKIGYETQYFDIYLYGKNLFDEEYATRAFEVSNTWYGRSGAPQTFGVILAGRF
jgi:iron complex outermembrane recepter protein